MEDHKAIQKRVKIIFTMDVNHSPALTVMKVTTRVTTEVLRECGSLALPRMGRICSSLSWNLGRQKLHPLDACSSCL